MIKKRGGVDKIVMKRKWVSKRIQDKLYKTTNDHKQWFVLKPKLYIAWDNSTN